MYSLGYHCSVALKLSVLKRLMHDPYVVSVFLLK